MLPGLSCFTATARVPLYSPCQTCTQWLPRVSFTARGACFYFLRKGQVNFLTHYILNVTTTRDYNTWQLDVMQGRRDAARRVMFRALSELCKTDHQRGTTLHDLYRICAIFQNWDNCCVAPAGYVKGWTLGTLKLFDVLIDYNPIQTRPKLPEGKNRHCGPIIHREELKHKFIDTRRARKVEQDEKKLTSP